MTNPAAPSKASGKLSISFGLISIPVDIFTGTEDVSIKRQQWTAEGKKVGSSPAIKNDDGTYGDLVSRDAIVKKYQTDEGILIDLTDDDIETAIHGGVTESGTAEIVCFQPFGLLSSGAYVLNGMVWQCRPSKLGTGRAAKDNPGGTKAYALLLHALKVEQSFALIKFVRSGTPYVAALLPSGRLVGLYHDDEVRQEKSQPDVDLTEAEVNMARSYISETRTAAVQTLDHPSQRVREFAEAKAKGQAPSEVIVVDAKPAHTDLLATLQASVDQAKAAKASKS